MTFSLRPIALVVLVAGIAASVFLTKNPPTAGQPIVAERRDAILHPTTAQMANQAENATAPLPAADARTLLKYGYLLESIVPADAESEELLSLLQAREEAARAGTDASTLDSAVLTRLDPARHAMYLALRDSEAEQRALGDFAGGLAHQAPLDALQRRELLFARLRHKQQYELMLDQGGIDRTGLSNEDRNYAHVLLTKALADYRDAYLEEMRAHLDAEQFRLLSDFEHTEFDLELQRLQQSINER